MNKGIEISNNLHMFALFTKNNQKSDFYIRKGIKGSQK